MATVTTERRKRGVFGWIVAILFWAFNAFMLFAVIMGISSTTDQMDSAITDAERAGTAIGATLGLGMILSVWFFGTIILGIMMLFTRGKKITITEERP